MTTDERQDEPTPDEPTPDEPTPAYGPGAVDQPADTDEEDQDQ